MTAYDQFIRVLAREFHNAFHLWYSYFDEQPEGLSLAGDHIYLYRRLRVPDSDYELTYRLSYQLPEGVRIDSTGKHIYVRICEGKSYAEVKFTKEHVLELIPSLKDYLE